MKPSELEKLKLNDCELVDIVFNSFFYGIETYNSVKFFGTRESSGGIVQIRFDNKKFGYCVRTLKQIVSIKKVSVNNESIIK